MSDTAVPTPSFQVRPATPAEWARVGDLTLHAYEVSEILGGDASYRDVLRDVAARAESPGKVLVAVDDTGNMLGTVTCCPGGSAFADIAHDDETEFRMLAVDPAARGRGVASALVASCADLARTWGSTRLVLSVINHNAAAESLYASLGFARVPARDWEPAVATPLNVWALEVR